MVLSMNHYTYRITYTDGKHYIGVRSCKHAIAADTAYVGSSKYTPNDLIESKEILGVFTTRAAALAHEIQLHAIYQVATSSLYYNRSNQTSRKFDTAGTKLLRTKEHNEKIKKALTGRKRSPEECSNISRAKLGIPRKPHSPESIEKMRNSKLGTPGYMKGQSYSAEELIQKYTSRLKYKAAYLWVNRKTGETVEATCIEMGVRYSTGVRPTVRFSNILRGVTKSYKGWVLKTESE